MNPKAAATALRAYSNSPSAGESEITVNISSDPNTGNSASKVLPRYPTIIPVNKRWRLRADGNQWCIERYKGVDRGKPRWRGVAFFRDLDQAAIRLLDMHLKEGRLSQVPEGWLEAFSTLMATVDAAKREIVLAMREVSQ